MKGSGMTQRYLKYTIAATDSAKVSFINLARDLSAINRQLFRQARSYKIKSIRIADDDGHKYVQLGCAPNTWAVKNAVKRAYRRWNEMNDQVLDDQPALKAKWNDFKPYLSSLHMQVVEAGSGGTLESPEDIGGQNLKFGEWAHSTFESPDGTSSVDGYKVGILGGHVGSVGSFEYVGLVKSYGDARGTVSNEEPSVDAPSASDDPLLNLLDAGTQFDEIAENIIGEGNRPPYRNEPASGQSFGDYYVGSSENMPNPLMFGECNPNEYKDSHTFYNVDIPLGVIRIDHELESGEPNTNFSVIIEVASGNYKGVHSEAMV